MKRKAKDRVKETHKITERLTIMTNQTYLPTSKQIGKEIRQSNLKKQKLKDNKTHHHQHR